MGIPISIYSTMLARLKKFPRVAGNAAVAVQTTNAASAASATPGIPLTITIPGQMRGGKNNMIVTRNGMHIPKKEWALWRNATVRMIRAQMPDDWKPISRPCYIELNYVAGDHRRRDMPAILDSIFHCLEKAGVVADDTFFWVSKSSRSYDKTNPRAEMIFYERVAECKDAAAS
jgi:Holliday junction resolvase RusA-like endonuclease